MFNEISLADTDSVLKVTIGTTSTAAAKLPGEPGSLLLVISNVDCYFVFGASGVAAASSSAYSVMLPAGTMLKIRNRGGYVRAIDTDGSSTGVLSFSLLKDV